MRRLRFAGLISLLVGAIVGTATAAGSAQSPAEAIRGAGPPIKVSNTNPKAVSSAALKGTHSYKIVVRGTVSDWPVGAEYPQVREGEGVDALYCYAKWRCPKPELWRQLRIDGSGLDEFAGKAGKIHYSASHVYTVTVSGVAGRLTLVSSDAQSSPDGNSGAYTVEITDRERENDPVKRLTVDLKHPEGFVPANATLRNGGTVRFCNRLDREEILFSRSEHKEILFHSPMYDIRLRPGQCFSQTLKNPTKTPILLRIRANVFGYQRVQHAGLDLTVLA